MQDVRRKQPIKYNKDGSVSLDGSGVKILRLLEPQGEPDIIECDGWRYMPNEKYTALVRTVREMATYMRVLYITENCPDSVHVNTFFERLKAMGVE